MSKKSQHNHPPKWADWFLAFYCNPKLLEQIQGDVYELYHWRLDEKGVKRAKRSFIWDVIRLFKWSNIKRSNKTQKLSNMGIFKNYFKVGIRNLWKQRMPSTINVIGLSIAIGCSVVVFKFVESNYVKDRFHENKEDIFLVTHWEDLESNKGRSGATDHALTREIINAVPGIKASSRYNSMQVESRVNRKISQNFAYFIDPDYLDMFTFSLLAGNPKSLNSANYIAIDERAAGVLFGEESGLDKKVELKIGDEWKEFTVGAIYKNRPSNSSLQLSILVNYQHFEQYLSNRDTWNVNFFVQRQPGVEPTAMVQSMDKLLPLYNQDNEDKAYINFELEPLTTMALNSNEITSGVGSAPNLAPVITLMAIGVFMLLLSTLNYVNISLAMVMKRLKEIGIRKVIGSRRKQLITQFITENLILCSLSMVLGLLLAQSFFLPSFNEIAGSSFTMDLLSHGNFLWFLAGLLTFITLVSGVYPALVASSYKPISILRKSTHKTGNRLLSNIFLTFQMILAMVTIVAAVMFVYTNRVNESIDWGYDQYNKLALSIPGDEYRSTFRDMLESNPSVKSITGTQSTIGQARNEVQFQNGEVKVYGELFSVGSNYPEVLGLNLVAGRLFDGGLESDYDRKLVVNETFLDQLQLPFDPDGTVIRQDSIEYSIIGVVEDYHYSDPGIKIRGAAMQAIRAKDYTSFLVEMNEGDILAQREQLQASLQELVEEKTVYVVVQEMMFDSFYEEMKGIRNMMLFTASVAVLLAAMGLYGLVNINVTSHIKDFGVRKVLGASGLNLTKTVVRKFRWVLALAVLIGCPIAVMLVGALINDIYAYAPAIGIGPLGVAISILLLVVFFTLNLQIQKVRSINPAETLRAE